MTLQYGEYKVEKPGLFAPFVTLILGSGISFVFATYMLDLTPAWIALLTGAVSSVLSFYILGENIGEAIVFSLILLTLVFFFLRVGPETGIIRTGIVPLATGICVGKLVYGLWKEASTK